MRKLLALALGLGLLSLPGLMSVAAKAQSSYASPPPAYTQGAGSPYTTGALKRKKHAVVRHKQKTSIRHRRVKRAQ